MIESPFAMENSYVLSPCFDFSESDRPMIKLDIWQDFAFNIDGATLEYQTNDNKNWYPVGNVGEGLNWFNSGTISGIPGSNGTGWTADNPINNWQTAKHKLDEIPRNQGLVRFRLAYGAPATSPADAAIRDGFAFDNIWIGERTKRVLIEYFTNMGVDGSIKEINSQFNEKVNTIKDVIDIQYHMNYPGKDTFFDQDPVSSNSRELYYSIANIPYAIIDGGRGDKPEFLIDFTSGTLEDTDLDLAVLDYNVFDIELNTIKGNGVMNIDVKVTSLKNLGQKYLTVYIVIIERKITDVVSDWGENEFESVVRAMLPDAVGTSYNINWTTGTSRQVNLDYFYSNIYDESQVHVVAFVQENDTREVFQVAIDNPNLIEGLKEEIAKDHNFLRIYPNPAKEYVSFRFLEPLPEDIHLEITDNSGRLVKMVKLTTGTELHSMYLNQFEPGIYFVRMIHNKKLMDVQKLVILGNNW